MNKKIIIIASIAGVAAVAATAAILLRKAPLEVPTEVTLIVERYPGLDAGILSVETEALYDAHFDICGKFLDRSEIKDASKLPDTVYFCPEQKATFTVMPVKKCSYFVSGRCDIYHDSPDGPRIFKTEVNSIKISDELISPLNNLIADRLSGGRDQLLLSVDEKGHATFKQLLISGQPFDQYPAWESQQQIKRREEGDFIVLRASDGWPEDPGIVFTNKNSSGKPPHLEFTKEGFFATDGSLSCMRRYGYMTHCPDDSPIGDSEWLGIGVNGSWEYSAPYTVLRISALKGKTVEIKYKDQTFSGEIPGRFTVFARKGSAIAKAQEETIEKTGVNTLIKELSACMTPQLKEESCFDKLVRWPLNAVIGANGPGDEYPVYNNVHEFYDALKKPEAQEFGILKSCLSGEFTKWEIDDHSITVRKEEFNEAAPYCRFKKVDGRWLLEEIADGLNYRC